MHPNLPTLLAGAALTISGPFAFAQSAPASAPLNPVASTIASHRTLPTQVDLRPEFERFGLGSPRQQGKRPTCSVFTVTGALEFSAARANGGHGKQLSVDYLNWAANQYRPRQDGGFFSAMWKGFSELGICAESEMAYADSFDSARKPAAEAIEDAKSRRALGLTHHWIKHWNPNTGVSNEQLREIKATLASGWPVCGGFRWPTRAVWKDGVLQMCDADKVYDGHSVLLVGYQDDSSQDGIATANGGGVFLFRDSDRHDGGQGKMPYTYLQSFMNDALWIDAPR